MRCCTTPGCGSYAINPGLNGRGKDDLHLCDVCYWKVRYTGIKTELAESVRIIEELDSHEGCWRWSHKLRVELDAFLTKHRSTT